MPPVRGVELDTIAACPAAVAAKRDLFLSASMEIGEISLMLSNLILVAYLVLSLAQFPGQFVQFETNPDSVGEIWLSITCIN